MLTEIAKIFGPKLETQPNNLALPVFAPNGGFISGLGGWSKFEKLRPDLHAIGDIGYADFYYYQGESEDITTAILYHRSDDKFVPLKAADDFAKRLEWDKAKFESIKKWLDERLPKYDQKRLTK